jgi:hypothetical protein
MAFDTRLLRCDLFPSLAGHAGKYSQSDQTINRLRTSSNPAARVKVRVTRVRDRIPQDMVDLLKSDAFGTVTEFRTVDGKGIGVVVELSDGSSSWFFEDEIVAA